MMGALGAQDVAVGALALAALGWLTWRRLRRKGEGCEDCPGCAIGAKRAAPVAHDAGVNDGTFIPIDELTRKR